MADKLHAKRKSVLEDFHGGSPFVSLKPAASASRLSLRARESALPTLSEALGLALPARLKSSVTSGLRSAPGSARMNGW